MPPQTPKQMLLRRHFRSFPAGWVVLLAWALLFCVGVHFAGAEQRFPPPDFTESGHQLPATTTPAARALVWQYLDVAVLLAALGTAAWLVHRKRSRKGLVALSIFSLLYFGFWREGCVCAIGSFQNVSLALFDSGYTLPVGVLAFFLLPLFFALFVGRAFCAGVCPHGALQDLVLVKPVKVPSWLEHGLSVLPFVYLGAGVLLAATGSAFLVCQYDPFVPLFRMNGRLVMVLAGAALLLLGLFVGRPYCRFLCPYGALLKLGAIVSKFRIRTTPDYCTQCRLCEASCPFGAMRKPEPGAAKPALLGTDRRRLVLLILTVPVLMAGIGFLGYKFSGSAARMHSNINLAERLVKERNNPPKMGVLTADDLALQRGREKPVETLKQAIRIRHNFAVGAWIFGAWVGLVIGAKLISLSVHRRRADYEPDRGDCVGCARCFEFCPNELLRRGIIPAPTVEIGRPATPEVKPEPVLTRN